MSRPPERIDRVVALIQIIWRERADLRFFQLVNWLEHEYSEQHNGYGRTILTKKEGNGVESPYPVIDLFHLEDGTFEKFLQKLLEPKI